MFKSSGPREANDPGAMMPARHILIEIAYLVATALFILSLKWMSSPTTAAWRPGR